MLMKITIFSCSSGGLIASACLAELGLQISIVDFDAQKISDLHNGIYQTYEPGLDFMLTKAREKKRIDFSTNIDDGMKDSEAVIVAVSTTSKTTFAIDLKQLHKAIEEIANTLKSTEYMPIIITSTVQSGTCENLKRLVLTLRPELVYGKHYSIICYTCFFRDGSAISDFLNPSRVIIGCDEQPERASAIIHKIFNQILHENIPVVITNFESSELIRNTSYCFALIKSAFINEIATLCSKTGADIDSVIDGIGLDKAIGRDGLHITPGIGGVIPRAANMLVDLAEIFGTDLPTLQGAIKSNSERAETIIHQIISKIGINNKSSHKTITILGLTVKPHTDDIRNSVSVRVITNLLKIDNINIFAYDPAYTNTNAKTCKLPQEIMQNKNFTLKNTVYEAANQSDAMIILTNWPEFLCMNLNKIYELMNKKQTNNPIIIDFHNMFAFDEMKNFDYVPQGLCQEK